MGASPTFTGISEYGTLAGSQLIGSAGNSSSLHYAISGSGSSAAVGATVTFTINGNTNLSAVYEGYYLNGSTVDPIVKFGSNYYVLGYSADVSPLPVVSSSYAFPACYVRGTAIETARGEVPVEALVIGDEVCTAYGIRRPVRWIGQRAYAGRFLAANPGVQPIRFAAGSLGCGLPRRDLLVSPEHAMFLDGLLVPARFLVNGTSIAPVRGLSRVEYFHVELDTHDVLLAEGAASETFLDDDSRNAFHNAAEFGTDGFTGAAGGFCAPRVEDGPALEAIYQRLLALAPACAA